MLISGAHPEVYRRGAAYSRQPAAGEAFTGLVLRVRDSISHPDPEAAAWAAFQTAFASLVLRVTYGPGFAAPATDDQDRAAIGSAAELARLTAAVA